ncbi:hypothetical protein PoB_002011800 [Plakobranchus ocellatus]|uniref:Uncharacterized protein n=1 Tax=Plakobranchus ocellatus TaxID=259542 RepID=A0AAV3ZG94_9GAST|nr:hypothetical protein PoB_002011800 [Plakobranchus ocellatus]
MKDGACETAQIYGTARHGTPRRPGAAPVLYLTPYSIVVAKPALVRPGINHRPPHRPLTSPVHWPPMLDHTLRSFYWFT